MLKLKIDVIKALKEAGVTASSIKHTKAIPQGTLDKLRGWQAGARIDVSTKSIDKVCTILKCQPGDILEWVPEAEEE